MLLLPELIVIIFLLYLTFRFKRRRLYELASKIPGNNGLLLIGQLHKFSNLQLKDYAKQVLSFVNSENKITKEWFGPLLVVLTDDADCIHTILNSPHALKKPSHFYNGFYMDEGLLVCNGEQYDRHRKILNKSFTISIVQKLLPTFNEKAKKCMQKLNCHVDQDDFDVFDYTGTCTLESFSTGQFNYDKDLYDDRVIDLFREVRPLLMRRVFSPWFNFQPLYKLTSLHRQLDEYYKIIVENVNSIRQANVESPNGILKDIVINLLMDQKNKFTETEIRDEIITFILAGHEATAISLSSVLLMLAIHKDAQQKVIDEIDSIIDAGDEIDNEDLTKFTYTEMAIKESLRLLGPGGILARQTSEEMELGGYTIPKDTCLVLSIFGMQRSEKYWGKDAHLFKPERFEPQNTHHPHALAPFSGGKRVCIGYKYAMAFMKIFLAHFFKTYTMDSNLKYDEITFDMIPTLFVSQKYMISLRKRKIKKQN